MAKRVCPFWLGYLLALPLRRCLHNPERILGPYVRAGMTVLDVGCAMGFFSLPLARMVGPGGKVVCVDVQERMLRTLRKRAARAGLAERIVPRLAGPSGPGLEDCDSSVDFALAFAMVHEVPDVPALFTGIRRAMKPGAVCLVAEPRRHVSDDAFDRTLAVAAESGLATVGRPRVSWCHAALLRKPE